MGLASIEDKLTQLLENQGSIRSDINHINQQMQMLDSKVNEVVKKLEIKIQEHDMYIKKSQHDIFDIHSTLNDHKIKLSELVEQNQTNDIKPESIIKIIKDHDKREKNVIIHNITESTSPLKADRKNYDMDKFTKIVALMEAQINIQHDILNCYRLGKSSSDKIKPLMIEFKSVESKSAFMRQTFKLKDQTEFKINIVHDMTIDERTRYKQLVKEAKELQITNKDFLYRVRGPPWNLQIKKIDKL